eukprot:NODE_3873_length_1969_cov_44.128664.p1 GENE.NODE_3873_length_1969_cov_44.128664~~NODE_3873_length_1969_cov_44.128664.p1  ORF type:complete len:526 (+),score=92.87 NODE_3873_length_1969_cov_44.128664:3-1580(+)
MFHLIFPIMACLYTKYQSVCEPGQTFVTFPPAVYGLILILFGVHAYGEFLAFGYSSLPYFRVVGRWTVFGKPVSQFTWLLISFSLSAVSFVGMVTPSLFSGTVFAQASMEACGQIQREAIWHKTMQEAIVTRMISGKAIIAKMNNIVFYCWLLQFCPLIYFFLTACPMTPRQLTSRGRKWDGEEYGNDLSFEIPRTREEYVAGERRYVYISLWTPVDDVQITGNSFYALAEAAGMNTISNQALSYPLARLGAMTQRLNEPMTGGGLAIMKKARQSMQHLDGCHHRLMVRVIFSGLFSSGFQLQIQISFFAMSLATKRDTDVRTVLAAIEAVIAICAAFLKCFQVVSSLQEQSAASQQLRELLDRIEVAINHADATIRPVDFAERQEGCWRCFLREVVSFVQGCGEYVKAILGWNYAYSNAEDEERELERQIVQMKKKVLRHGRLQKLLVLGAVAFFLNIIWAVVKVCATYYCPDHMFNWSFTFKEDYGCVDLSEFRCFKDKAFNTSAVEDGTCVWSDPCCNWHGQ